MNNLEKNKLPTQKLDNTLNVRIQSDIIKDDDKSLPEDTTRYGENIPSQFNWVSYEKQKKRAEELEKEIKN